MSADRSAAGPEVSSADAARATLQARAERLAVPLDADVTSGDASEAIVVMMGGERLAIEARYVLEVVPLGAYAPLPADAAAFGLINWRGAVLTVRDLRSQLGIAAAAAERRHIVVLGRVRALFGLVVDGVGEIVAVSHDALQAPPNDRGRSDWVRGVTPDAVLVLDVPALLNSVEDVA